MVFYQTTAGLGARAGLLNTDQLIQIKILET